MFIPTVTRSQSDWRGAQCHFHDYCEQSDESELGAEGRSERSRNGRELNAIESIFNLIVADDIPHYLSTTVARISPVS